MLILGLSGLLATEDDDYPPVTAGFFHDSSAALTLDGQVVAAVEEERLNREKHSNRFPARAARSCLEQAGVTPGDLDAVAYFFAEGFTDAEVCRECNVAGTRFRPVRDVLTERLTAGLGGRLAPDRLLFVTHHTAHAASAYVESGWDEALVVVMDGNGEEEAVSVYTGREGTLDRLAAYGREHSLGHFYERVTRFLGFDEFGEYKVMGLAAFGDPARFREVLRPLVRLTEGGFELDTARVPSVLLEAGLRPRSGRPIRAEDRDLAAAAQEVVERVGTHLTRYWAERTGVGRLALAGGVAQNTSLNGLLLGSGSFDEVFVPPAPHDGGAGLGAAYAVDALLAAPRPRRRLAHPYLGPSIGTPEEIRAELSRWADLVEVHRPADLLDEVAAALDAGEILGWAQGRSELGPRALGNRSILADPRPVANRDRVNLLVKRREEFRPFAPAVLAAEAERFFDFGGTPADHRFMGFVVPVRPDARARLGAVTHHDGTARVQVVHRVDNPLFHDLVERFGRRTGVPVLLNTSFNNYAEPVVLTVADAVVCLLTTGLAGLAVGPYVVRPLPSPERDYTRLAVSLMPFVEMRTIESPAGTGAWLGRRGGSRWMELTGMAASVVREAALRPGRSFGELATGEGLRDELLALWERRLIRLVPAL